MRLDSREEVKEQQHLRVIYCFRVHCACYGHVGISVDVFLGHICGLVGSAPNVHQHMIEGLIPATCRLIHE